jgi:hypothetical protein
VLASTLVASVAVASPLVVHEETVTGSASGHSVSTSSDVAAVAGDLYLVAVSTRPYDPTAFVAGLGLSWATVVEQCGGRSQTGVSLWWAQGTPGAPGPVSANLSDSADNVVITVTRYSGVDGVAPIATAVSANSNGIGGGCSGGRDEEPYSFDVPVGLEGEVVYAAIAHRHYEHTMGVDFTERGAVQRGSGGETASLSIVDATPPAPTSLAVAGEFSREADGAGAAVVVRPAEEGPPSMGVTTTGPGSVILGPPGGVYEDGTRVALVANPLPGWRFVRWEGSLSSSANPDSVTATVGASVNAVFEKMPRHAVTLTTVGSGSVMLSPPGGEYPEGSVVTVTAQPAPGWSFAGWTGAVDGAASPDALTMDAPRSLTATFTHAGGNGQAIFEEVQPGMSSGSASVTTSVDLAGANGDLLLAAISTRPLTPVVAVSGLGLEWVPVAEQCAGRAQTGVAVWMAQGVTAAGPVEATLSSDVESAVIAVSRYSGVDAATPLGAMVGANTRGVGGSCSGGDDDTSYSFDLDAAEGTSVFAAIAHRHRVHSTGPDLVERATVRTGSGGGAASVSIVGREAGSSGTVTVSGSFDGDVDWAGLALEIRTASGPILHTTTEGLGVVQTSPPAPFQGEGTSVTLTAVPHDGWEFEEWTEGLSGTVNPESVTLSAPVHVAARFRRSDVVQLRRSAVGSGNVVTDPAGDRHAAGTPVTFTAVPYPDWVFERWEGAATGTGNPVTAAVTDEENVVAYFRYTGEAAAGLWTSPAEIAARPLTGPAWDAMLTAADASFDPPDLDRASMDNVECLAAAIVYRRTHDAAYRKRVVRACSTLAAGGLPGDETLDWAREIGAYALAADLVGYRTPELEVWFANVAENWEAADGRKMIDMFRERPNNWGMNAFGTLAAVYGYLGDALRLNEIRQIWLRGVCGPDPGFDWGERSWHADPADPRLINPRGSARDGLDLDGVLPDDQRRGGTFASPPPETGYPWGALQGMVMAARILERCDPHLSIWHVGDDAIGRAAHLLHVSWEGEFGGWAAEGDDLWMLPFLDDAYGTEWASGDPGEWGAGKNAGWAYVLLPPSNETAAPVTIVPAVGGRLHPSFPNPFVSATNIRYSLDRGSRVDLAVFDVTGRLVITLRDGVHSPGAHRVRWSGVDSHGRPVASGVYWVRLRTGHHQEAIKLTVLR